MITSIDIETYSSVDLAEVGVTKYAASPDFEILMMAFAIDDGPVHLIDFTKVPNPAHGLLTQLDGWMDEGHTITAYNASFEWTCICAWLGELVSPAWREQLLQHMRCTMAQAAYCGLPIGLAATGAALQLPQDKQKLALGRKLIDVFSKPSKKALAGARVTPQQEPDKWQLFMDYCRQDVEAERAIAQALAAHPLPEDEWALWRNTCRLNARGIQVDEVLAQSAMDIMQDEQARLQAEAADLGLNNPKSLPQLKAAVNAALEGIEEVTTLRRADVEELIERYPDNERLQALLQGRLAGGKSSLAKYPAIEAAALNGRVHDLTQYYGASRSGRFAGRGVQPQNLPRNSLKNLGLARRLAAQGNTEGLRLLFEEVQDTLSQLIRTAFVPAAGSCFLVADYAAIEARVIAWLAGERWAMDVFAGHGRIYEATASAMFGVPLERIQPGLPDYSLRQKGKVATLALGYAGGTGALVAMGALRSGLTEAELPDIVSRWRAANPNIVQLWADVEAAALDCVRDCRPISLAHGLVFEMTQVGRDMALTIELPSGRKLYYIAPQVLEGGRFNRPSLHYLDAKAGGKMLLTPTFGGKLVENCLAGDSLVITRAGLTPLSQIEPDTEVWDGVSYVRHGGLVCRGPQRTVRIGGLRMTPDHEILTTKGWVRCGESEGLDWAPAILPGINLSSINVTLTKGAGSLTLTHGAVSIGGWSEREITITGTTTSTAFTVNTGAITCSIKPNGTGAYDINNFLAHKVGSLIEANIVGPGGGGSAQLCEVRYVP